MAKMVGYSCNLKLPWLNQAARLFSEHLPEDEYKKRLNDFLSFEIGSETRLRKTREILMNVWYYDNEEIRAFRQEALNLLEIYPDDASSIHLCMIYLTYPVVADICRYMGRMFEFQDEITNTMLCRRLYDEWGERGTLQSTSRRVTLTLKELNFLKAPSRTRYALIKHCIKDKETINFLLRVAIKIDDSSYHSFAALSDLHLLFPFDYSISKEQLMQDGHFMLTTFDGQLSIALRE